MVGRHFAGRQGRPASLAYRTLIKSLSATLFAAALLTIAITVFGAPLHAQMQPFLLVISICAATPVIFVWFWRQQALVRANTALKRLAFHDTMLGCLNRRGFATTAQSLLQSATRKSPCALLVIDIDRFKSINESFGYLEGDNALKIIAAAIKSCVRSTDVIGRLAGEEFGVLLKGADTAHTRIIAARISDAVTASHFMPDDKRFELTVSIGGAVAEAPTPVSELLADADRHLYAAKKQGRDRVTLTDAKQKPLSRERSDAA